MCRFIFNLFFFYANKGYLEQQIFFDQATKKSLTSTAISLNLLWIYVFLTLIFITHNSWIIHCNNSWIIHWIGLPWKLNDNDFSLHGSLNVLALHFIYVLCPMKSYFIIICSEYFIPYHFKFHGYFMTLCKHFAVFQIFHGHERFFHGSLITSVQISWKFHGL